MDFNNGNYLLKLYKRENETFRAISIIDDIISLSWTLSQYMDDEIIVETNIEHYSDIEINDMLVLNDELVGFVKSLSVSREEDGEISLVIKAIDPLMLLERRVIDTNYSFESGSSVSDAMDTLLTNLSGSRSFGSWLEWDDLNGSIISDVIIERGSTLKEALDIFSAAQGFIFYSSFSAGGVIVKAYFPQIRQDIKLRTLGGEVLTTELNQDVSDYATSVYVVGSEGEMTTYDYYLEQRCVWVDNDLRGFDRYEVKIDSTASRGYYDEDNEEMIYYDLDVYEGFLKTEGEEELAKIEDPVGYTFSLNPTKMSYTFSPTGQLYIGDIISIVDEVLGIEVEAPLESVSLFLDEQFEVDFEIGTVSKVRLNKWLKK